MGKVMVLGSTDLAILVGIQPTLLNKFVERKQYGIDPSVRPGAGRGKERLFGERDVLGIALVHWLFESGLRSESIQFVLNQVCGGLLDSAASDAAAIVLGTKKSALVITREPRTVPAKHPKQRSRLYDLAKATELVGETSTASVLIIPIGNLYASLQKRWEETNGNL